MGAGERGRRPPNADFSFEQGWPTEIPAIFAPLEAGPEAVANCSGRKEHRRTERAPGEDYQDIATDVILKISCGMGSIEVRVQYYRQSQVAMGEIPTSDRIAFA